MPPPDAFIPRLLAMLTPLGPVEARAMFGGHGLYLDGLHFAIVHGGRVYFRVDTETAASFAAGGGQPFRYRRNGRPVAIDGYREPPTASLGTTDMILPWAERGVAAARRISAGKRRERQKKAAR